MYRLSPGHERSGLHRATETALRSSHKKAQKAQKIKPVRLVQIFIFVLFVPFCG
jgi:hypothetical protein